VLKLRLATDPEIDCVIIRDKKILVMAGGMVNPEKLSPHVV